MASPQLHIKDAYYFEVPKALWRSRREDIDDFPDWWVRNDHDFQHHEAEDLYAGLNGLVDGIPSQSELLHDWEHWQHAGKDHANAGKPLDVYLEEQVADLKQKYKTWTGQDGNAERSFEEFLHHETQPFGWFAAKLENADFAAKWTELKESAGGDEAVEHFAANHTWSQETVAGYNSHLHGKILIPQPFGGELRNAYQAESGFCVSKFMIIELVVAILLVTVLGWLGKKMSAGGAPQGRLWNLIETLLLFIRDQVARPAIGKHDADKFVPLLWTIFLFVMALNLMGAVPWVGAPTSAFGVTLALAGVTVGTGILFGSIKFGVVGFWLNQVPQMDLPFVMAIVIKPMIFLIEVLGFFIKHSVLAVRLLANMVAGHLVLLGIMGLAFSIDGAKSDSWALTAVISVVASTLFSVLELGVALLQAYIFTFLSALFIGAAIHHH
ncbi:MAG: F0F1 ATP synthase subunit A [Pirellulaceae bacterium]|jgi:F-type H+-transporting ATPase subunit a|nr:F0F1 ATP synthase subunit A [Pirellulaceae bacterium]MDP7015065.1 F0F1 ATP synthase subunit A [Pirellulaceae bacterium]